MIVIAVVVSTVIMVVVIVMPVVIVVMIIMTVVIMPMIISDRCFDGGRRGRGSTADGTIEADDSETDHCLQELTIQHDRTTELTEETRGGKGDTFTIPLPTGNRPDGSLNTGLNTGANPSESPFDRPLDRQWSVGRDSIRILEDRS